MTPQAPNLQRLFAAFALCAAFAVMASVFVPYESTAQHGTNGSSSALPPMPSTDPHEGLKSIGSLEHRDYQVRVFATDGGARFSIYDAEGVELAALMSAERVAQFFPDLPLPEIDFSAPDSLSAASIQPVQIMMVQPNGTWSR